MSKKLVSQCSAPIEIKDSSTEYGLGKAMVTREERVFTALLNGDSDAWKDFMRLPSVQIGVAQMLASAAASQEPQALEVLFKNRYFRERLKTLCLFLSRRGITPVSNWEDLFQSVCLRLCSRITQFKGESTIITYVSQIATNIHSDQMRKKRVEMVEMDDISRKNTETTEFCEMYFLLHEALALLSETHRKVVECKINGMTFESIAKELGLPRSTVYEYWKGVQKRLAEYLLVEKR